MAKTPTVNTITSGYASQTQLNENFTNIQTAFENTLSLDGSTPNAMGADLDLNNNDILNIGSFQAQTITLGGSSVDLSDIQSLTSIASDIQTLADIEDGTDATDAIQTVAGISTEVSAVGPISSDVTTVAGISANVTSVAGNTTNINAVAAIDSDVTTVSGISSDVTTVAADGSDIGVVAGLTTEVQALGPIASDITTVSGISANVTTVSGISSNVSTVAGIASDISAVSPIAANVTTVAGISADVTSVANISSDITAINAQLTDLQTVADDLNEVTSEIETVAASIANVDLVGNNISTVSTVADNLSDVNNFFSVYRTGTTEPTTSLDVGDLFYDTSANALKIYNGTGWEAGVTAGSGFLALSGGTLTGALNLNADPTTELGAATKQYVDTIAAAGLHYHDPVRVEKEGNLNVTYNNGTNGVGATLTNAGTQEALVIDGVTMVVGDRVLVYEQSDATQNGVYTVTDIGSGSTNWVLTRATDADSYGASDPNSFGQGDAFFVLEGAEGAGELYVMNTQGTITFGTTDITFTQVASTAVYSAGTNLSLNGTVFNVSDTPSFTSVTIGGSAALKASDIGSSVQAYDGQLADLAGLSPTVGTGVVGDGTNFISTGSSTDAIQIPAGTEAQRPGSPVNGMIRYSTTSNNFEGYQNGAWAAIGGSDLGSPTLSGSSSANEYSDTTVTITDYDSNLIYRVSVTGGSYTRSGGTITWTLPGVTTDTIHYMTVNAIDNGVTSPDAEWDIDVLNVPLTGDTGIQITDFSSNTSNTGWDV